jgi:hypothetical protein
VKPDHSVPSGHRATRRELLRGAVVAGTVVSGVPLLGPPEAWSRTPRPTDADLLRRLIGAEQVIAFAYAHVLGASMLSSAATQALTPFLDHEHQHVRDLATELGRLGAVAPAPPINVRNADRALAGLHVTNRLGELHTEVEALELLIGAEAGVVGAYYLAISQLADRRLVEKAAQTMADEAQHATALRRLLHPRSITKFVPNAFVDGRH